MTSNHTSRKGLFRWVGAVGARVLFGALFVAVSVVAGGVGPVHAQSPVMEAQQTAKKGSPEGTHGCAEGTHWSQNLYACVADIVKPEGGAGAFALLSPGNLANLPFPPGIGTDPGDSAYIVLKWGDAGIDLSCTAGCDVYQYYITDNLYCTTHQTDTGTCPVTPLNPPTDKWLNKWLDRKSQNSGGIPLTKYTTYYWQVRTRGDQRYSNSGWFSFTVTDYTRIVIQGTVISDSGPGGLGGVTLTYKGSTSAYVSGTTKSGAGGLYSINVPYGWTGRVTPKLSPYTFAPTSIFYTSPQTNADVTGQDYVGTYP